jgi:hypothetical protein
MRRLLLTLAIVGLLAVPLPAFDAVGTIRRVDADNRLLVIEAVGQNRTIRVATDVEVLDRDGQVLPAGIRTRELQEGAEVTITVETDAEGLVVKTIRLGKRFEVRTPQPRPSIGLKPLTEMTAADRYKGEDGGLYGGGRNGPPQEHVIAAQREVGRIAPLDAAGTPARDGKIGFVSISMSNATAEFSLFKQLADSDLQRSPRVEVVDCAQDGQAMEQWVNPRALAWLETDRRLRAANLSLNQVQIAWVKLANIQPTGELAEHGGKLHMDTVSVLQNAKARFPNLRMVYLSSRIYGGWATTPLNPEPYAYEGAFVVRWLIRDQMNGDRGLNYDPAAGPVKAPLLLWGPYLWADGTTPRKTDGLTYQRIDLAGDGTHPSESGRRKVAELLLDFVHTDAFARQWYLK